ncbi:MAG: hypothetical protein QOI92_888 [Chloroflexota bacterium]|jgi:hypothetical protein|nr:hypothetical protein [Chloroflexota bacterium]
MNALFPYLIAIHQRELIEQAELRRRAKLSTASQAVVPTWRRSIGWLLASAARSLDPEVELVRETQLTNGSGANALPAC